MRASEFSSKRLSPGQWTVDAILDVVPMATEIWFHGSRAIGKHKRTSDTDILVVLPDEYISESYLKILRILQKLSNQYKGYDIQPTHANTNIHRIAQEEGRLLWSKQDVAEGFSNSEKYQGIIMSMVEGEDGFKLTAKNSDGQKLGFVEFSYDTDGTLRPEELEVHEKYRGKGIAKIMYDYVKNQGFKIAKSSEQTPSGLAFWNKHRPDKRIWEQDVVEAPLPPDWDPEKLNLRQTFKDRLKYALDRAKRLGGGSSRVAMTIDYEGRPTALKVAKNLKGLAQNEAEIEILQDGYAGRLPVVIPLIDYDKANKRPVWMQTEIAKKVSGPTLAKMLHAPALWFLTDVVKIKLGRADMYRQNTTVESMKKNYLDPRMWTSQKKTPTEQDWEIFMTYVDEVAELVSSTTLDIGDLNTPSNWGIFNNRPVIIDLGFTDETKGLYGFKE